MSSGVVLVLVGVVAVTLFAGTPTEGIRRIPDRIPGLLAPLEAKADGISNQLRVRINRNFPEKFSAWLKSSSTL